MLFSPDGQEDRIGSFSNVTFWSDDVKGAYEALKARGVEFVQEPETADWGDRGRVQGRRWQRVRAFFEVAF